MKSPRRLMRAARYWLQDTLDVRFGNPLRGIGTFFRRQLTKIGWLVGRDHEKGLTTREVIVKESDEAVIRDRPAASNYLNPLFVASLGADWIKRWITSRSYLAMLQALPAVVIGAGLIFAMSPISGASKSEAVNFYRVQTDRAVSVERPEVADLCLRKLCSLEPTDLSLQFARAEFLAQSDKQDKAAAMMVGLAKQGHTDADLWLGKRLFDEYEQSPEEFSNERKQAMLRSLLKVVSSRRTDPEANRLLGLIYLQESNPERAIAHLKEAARTKPELAFVLARVFHRTHDYVNAASFARQAWPVVEQRHKLDPISDPVILQMTTLRLMLGKEEEAIKELIDVGRLVNSTHYNNAIAECYVEWSRRIMREDGGNFSTKLPGTTTIEKCVELVDKALQFNPMNQYAIEQLGLFATINNELSNKMLHTLRQILTTRSSAGAHFVLGTHALIHDEFEAADLHFRQAEATGQAIPALLNNMAMLKYKTDRLEEALELANQAIELQPEEPHFRDTRGKIHKASNRLTECIADFEKALSAPDLKQETHRVLVDVYRQLGDSALADVHAQQLN
ncbi:hypothetical protein OAH18_01865 [bacterium]|nr:hypothetical protein [bacterium]